MGAWDYLRGVWNAVLGRDPYNRIAQYRENKTVDQTYAHYDKLDLRYTNDDHEDVVRYLQEMGEIPKNYSTLKTLRNPVNRVVEVYSANILSEDLLDFIDAPAGSDDTANVEPLKPLIRKVWDWAEWREEARRSYPLHGELWIKATSSDDGERVYPQLLDPRYITDFDKNERGYLTFLRLDIPQKRRGDDGENEDFVYVEVWDKSAESLRIWEDVDPNDLGNDLEDLGPPDRTVTLAPTLNVDSEGYTGYDFIPVVHIPFRRMLGHKRGHTPYDHAVVNIDRLNELVTKLHGIMFPSVVWVVQREAGAGAPLDPIRLEGVEAATAISEAERQGFEVIQTGEEKMIRLPAGASLDYKIPNLNYDSHLAVIESEMQEIERLLPELAYYRLRELELSGYAIELSLKDLIDRIRAARSNLERGLSRFNQMAITIGQVMNILEFQSVGLFEDGVLEHTFSERDVFSPTEKDQAERLEIAARALEGFKVLGLLEEALKQLGYDEAESRRLARSSEQTLEQRAPALDLFGGFGGQGQGQQQQPATNGNANQQQSGNQQQPPPTR